jgi:hypothetical protein
LAATAEPEAKTTVPPALTTGVAIERVLVSAVVEESEQVETPRDVVAVQEPMVLFDPLEVNVGVTPEIRFELASARVIVITDVDVPSGFVGPVPVIVEFAANAAPAVNTTVPPALTTGVAIESVLVSAFVDFKVQVETPEAFDEEQAVIVFPLPVFVAVKVGTVPETGLLVASLRVMVTVDVAVLSATTGPVPVIVEFAATAAPAVNTIVPPVFKTGFVIRRVFVSAVADEKVQTDTPLASDIEQIS